MSKSRYEVRNPFGYDSDSVSRETGLECQDDSLTIQADAEDADINTIVKRFGLTGQLPSNVRMPVSADVADAVSYHEAMNVISEAKQGFMQFPADVRARFGNDPANMITFLENPDNREEAERLGLVVPKVQTPSPASAVLGAAVPPPVSGSGSATPS